jgi:hypothetical protein
MTKLTFIYAHILSHSKEFNETMYMLLILLEQRAYHVFTLIRFKTHIT